MQQEELKKTVEDILDSDVVGVMSTVREDKPYSRYMSFFHEGLKLYTATNKDTHKVEDIEANSNTHILLGYEGEGFGDEYVEYEGRVAVSNSNEMKEKLWNPHMETWFSGPDDSNLIILEITPERICLMNKKGKEPKVLNLNA